MTPPRPPRRIAWELIGPLALAAACLWPMLRTGYLSDDLAHSLTPGVVQLNGGDALGWTLRSTAEMIRSGRFYPAFWFHCHAVYHAFRDERKTDRLGLKTAKALFPDQSWDELNLAFRRWAAALKHSQ